MCDQNVIETESHFLLCCSKYNQLRYDFMAGLTGLFDRYPNFDYSNEGTKLTILMSSEYVKSTAKFIFECFDLRRKTMYILS